MIHIIVSFVVGMVAGRILGRKTKPDLYESTACGEAIRET